MKLNFTKHNLKTGDFVVRRNKNVEFYYAKYKIFIGQNWGFNDFNEINSDLTANIGGEEWDIIKVYRPKEKLHCSFSAYNDGKLVFNRE